MVHCERNEALLTQKNDFDCYIFVAMNVGTIMTYGAQLACTLTVSIKTPDDASPHKDKTGFLKDGY